MITLHFKKPGLQTTVQDKGRLGYLAFGVPCSGAMDKRSARLANWLVGNKLDAPVLEITFMGPQIEIQGDCQIAITGANISPTLNGEVVNMYETISIKEKGLLGFGRLQNGCRAYLGVNGDWQIEKWLGSYSATVSGDSKLPPQSIIQKDSTIHIISKVFIPKRSIPAKSIPKYSSHTSIRVCIGPEFDLLSREEIARFFGQKYRISRDSNRMGYRIEGSTILENSKREIISSGIIPGTIQLTKSGQPVILVAEAQTTGGYYRIANVITPDLDLLGQMKPGDTLRFELVSLEEAQKINDDYFDDMIDLFA